MKRTLLILVLAALLLPAGLLAQAQGETLQKPVVTVSTSGAAIVLSWNAVPGATRYEVWTHTGDGWSLLDGNVTATGYTHADVVAGATYWYAVRAASDSQVSPWSEYVSGTGPAQTGGEATATPHPTHTPAPTPTASSAVTQSCGVTTYVVTGEGDTVTLIGPRPKAHSLARYRARFGESLDIRQLVIFSAGHLLIEGRWHVAILYLEPGKNRGVVEVYRECVFIGASVDQLEPGWWRDAQKTVNELQQRAIDEISR